MADRFFRDYVLEDDFVLMEKEWYNLTELRRKVLVEIRLNAKWYHEASKTWKNVWNLAGAMPEGNEDSSLNSIMGCYTDISLQKVSRPSTSERLAKRRICMASDGFS